MCGITAYKGEKQAAPILVEALRKLEYRGYDSAGLAVLDKNIEIRKGVGKVNEVNKNEKLDELEGNVGISHTRWATTGTVTKKNAHPHYSNNKRFALVQNGIVENYQMLRKSLEEKGYTFVSETDTEVIVNLIENETKAVPLLEAIRNAFRKLHGRNAFVLLDGESGKLYAARKGSPLLLGIADSGTFLASDASPILEHTRKVIFLDDNELVQIDEKYTIYDIELNKVEKEISQINWTQEQAQKGDYPHFMIKEIMEQKTSIKDALAQEKELIEQVAKEINGAFGTYIVGCGTAGKVGLAATYAFSHIASKHLNFALGSEFPNYHKFLTEKSLLIAISQSGETADTLEAIEVAQEKGCKIISIVNALGSTMDRIADYTVPVHAGPEKSVCSTKATTNQMAIMFLLAYACAGKYDEGKKILEETAIAIDAMLTEEFTQKIETLAHTIKDKENAYIIGRDLNYPMALESAIKIQEVSYIHAEGFAGGELKHGPIALIEEGTPLIVLVANDETKEDTLSNALEVKARGGMIIGVAPENNDMFDAWIEVPDLPQTSPIANIIPIQLLSYYLSVAKGNDVDMPRNLAKSVTVK